MNVRFEVAKTSAGYYVWRLMRGDVTVYQSREFLSAKGAAESADQVIAAMLQMVRGGGKIWMQNKTGEEI